MLIPKHTHTHLSTYHRRHRHHQNPQYTRHTHMRVCKFMRKQMCVGHTLIHSLTNELYALVEFDVLLCAQYSTYVVCVRVVGRIFILTT